MIFLGVLTAGMVYLEDHYIVTKMPQLTIFHQISGFVISLVLVFRINTAYDRWWEGRKMWGALINSSRNIAIKLNTLLSASETETRKYFCSLITNFTYALKEHLRNNYKKEELLFSKDFTEEMAMKAQHKPAFIASKLNELSLQAVKKNNWSSIEYQMLTEDVDELMDICGGCERIKNTPIPYSYSIFIKKIIFIYVITMPFTFGFTTGYWSVPIVMIIFYAFASLELLSEEIEDPFGLDPNDLPTDDISAKIKKNVHEILLGNGGVQL